MEFIMSKCECGRSPNGNCVGWHNLTEEQYLEKKQLMKKSNPQGKIIREATDIQLP